MKKIISFLSILLTTTVMSWAQNYPVAHGANENITHGTHYPKTVSIRGTQTPEFKIENIATAIHCPAYFDKTSTVFEVKAGDIVTPDITINGDWMHGFVFVDWNQNGQFLVSLLGDGPYTEGEGNELVCYSHYHKTSGDNPGWNSAGEAVGGNVLSPGSFRVPSDLTVGSTYRMRYSVTWNCADPSGNYANFLKDGASIIDVTLKIVGKAEDVKKYPIDDYDEPNVGESAPAAEWNALTSGLHASWASRDVQYQRHRVPTLTETTSTTITAWRGERANTEAVLFANADQGKLRVRFSSPAEGQDASAWCSARFINYVITDDDKACGAHNMNLIQWLSPDVIDQDKAHAVPAMQTRPVWCSIQVPHNAAAGNYSANLEIVDEQDHVVKTLTLGIEVDSHTLPAVADQKFHLDLWQQPYSVSRYYEVDRWSDEHIAALRPYLKALGDAGQKVVSTILFYEPWGDQTHDKFSPMIQTTKTTGGQWVFDYTVFDKYVSLCNEYGINEQINCYSMVPWDMKFRYYDEKTGKDIDWALTAGSTDYNALWDAYLTSFKAHLQEKGWFDKTCIAMDERGESAMLAAYNLAHAKGFKMSLAGNFHSSLNEKLYDYSLALNQVQNLNDTQRKYRKDNNLKTTIYVSCADAEPNIYTNSLPAEATYIPLHAAANDLDGFLHWSWINWDEHPLTDSRFRLYGSGDTYSYYPGNRSSVRFERLVEGIHQYEKIQILKEEYKSDAEKLKQLNTLLADCKDYAVAAEECAAKVNRLEDFLNGKEVEIPENTLSGYWKIKVDDTHFAKAKANLTQWNTELSSQTEYDLFQIEGTPEACTIKLMGRSNNIGPDASKKLFVDQTAAGKYSIIETSNGKVKLKNGQNWVYVSGGTFTFSTTNSTELMLEYVMPSTEPTRTTLFSTLAGGMDIPPYRIPGITCGKDGRLIASAARLVCGTDPGFGQVDCVVKISDDNGKTWSSKEIDAAVGNASLINNTKTPMEAAYGDPAVVMDKEHNEVLIMAVGGCTVYTYGSTTRQNPNIIACIRSLDGGLTWQTPVEQTEDIYGLFDNGNTMQAAFVGGGKLFQSRIVKVGEYYRLYAALAARPNGNRVVYSDDFGRTWKVLGAVTDKPVPNGDEPKCEELPDGRVIITSRTGGGRLMNIYTYSNTRTGAGKWETETKATMSGLSASPSSNATNGEMLIVPAKRKSDGKNMYVALQSVPTGSGRNNVGIFYKELADITDIADLAAFTSDWNGFYQVSSTASAYSSIELQADDKIAFFYEETLTKWGTKPNPVSTSFPTGSGTHNFDGFENIYVPLELEMITGGKYSVCREVNRGEYLKTFFTYVVNASDLNTSEKANVMTKVNNLPAEPTIDQIDAIRALLGVREPADKWDGKNLTFTNIQQNNTKRVLYINNGTLEASTQTADELGTKAQFKCTKQENGKYSFYNEEAGLYMIWRAGGNYGYNSNKGTLDTYNATYCDWVLTPSNSYPGGYWMYSYRNGGTNTGSLILLSSGAFDSYSATEGWASNYSNIFIIEEVGAPAEEVEALQDKIDAILPGIQAGKIGYPRLENTDVQGLIGLKTVTPQNYDNAKAAYDKVMALGDVNLPVSGKAYTIAIRKSDGTKNWYIKGTGFTDTAANADIFVCGKAASGDFPYVFVTNENKFLTSRGVNTAEAYTAKVNDFKAEAMVGHGSTFISSTYPTFGTICLTAQGRSNNLNSTGTIIVKEATSGYDNSSAPYLNGQFTSALIVEEASYPYNNVELKKAGTSDTEAYATVYLPFDMQMPAGIEVYKATEERDVNNKTYLKLARVNTENGPVAKGAYVLYSESVEGKNVIVPTATKLTAGTDNLLIGSTDGSAQRSALKNPYVLAYKGTPVAVGFYRYTADVYPLGKAIYDDSASQANCFNFDFGNNVDAISTLRSEGTDSILIDLSGRRVNNNTKAIVIKNGAKIIK